jgi:hypothetical protein
MHRQFKSESKYFFVRSQAKHNTEPFLRLVAIQPIIFMQCLVTTQYPVWQLQIELFKENPEEHAVHIDLPVT